MNTSLQVLIWLAGIFIVLVTISKILLLRRLFAQKYLKWYRPSRLARDSYWIYEISFWLVFAIAIGEFYRSNNAISLIHYVGFALIFIAGLVKISAKHARKQYLIVQVSHDKEKELLTKGIYSRVRHPTALSALLFLAGIACAIGSVFSKIFLVVFFIPAVIYRINTIDEAMREKYKVQYERYMKQVKKLIPGIY